MIYRFYIDNIEVQEPNNWDTVKTKISRDNKYRGLVREASIDELEFGNPLRIENINNAYIILKNLFITNGVNATAKFKIEKLDFNLYEYYIWNEFAIDFQSYEERVDKSSDIVKVGLVDNNIWKKIQNREKIKLKVLNNTSVDGVSVTPPSSEEVEFMPLPLVNIYNATKGTYSTGKTIENLDVQSETAVPLFPAYSDFVVTIIMENHGYSVGDELIFEYIEGDFVFNFNNFYISQSQFPIRPYVLSVINNDAFIIEIRANSDVNVGDPYVANSGRAYKDFSPYYYDFIGSTTADFLKILPFSPSKSNDFMQGTSYTSIDLTNINDVTNVELAQASEALNEFNCFFIPTPKNYDVEYDFNIEIQLDSNVTNGDVMFRILEFDYDGVDFINPIVVISHDFTTIPTGVNVVTKNFNGTFEKKASKYYVAGLINTSTFNGTIKVLDILSLSLNLQYLDFSEPSKHKAYTLKDCFSSILQQITDVPNVLQSSILDDKPFRSPLSANTQTFVTSGFLLRDAVNSDDTPIDLELSFDKLWETANAITPLSMQLINGSIVIEEDTNAYGVDEVELDAVDYTKKIDLKQLYTDVEVGNQPINYEDDNGNLEPNAIHNFSTALNVQENKLSIKTAYNTDYLGVEKARGANFSEEANKDTKTDDKVFLVYCIEVASTPNFYRTLGSNVLGYADVSGLLPDSEVFNLPFSPKRMLIRHSGYIRSALDSSNLTELRYESSLNLATMVSEQLTIQPDLSEVVERDSVDIANMKTPIYKPFTYILQVGEREIDLILRNKNNYFKFVFNNQEIIGYLWDAEIQKDKGTVTIIEKW